MSQRCPQCRLISPAEAARCDCGYDFASKTVKPSYLLAHLVEKHGGEAKIVQNASRARIRSGIFLLAVVALIAGGSLLAGGKVYFLGWAAMWGALRLYRGWRQRGQRFLDRATRDELIRRS